MPRILNKKIWPHQVTLKPCELSEWAKRKDWLVTHLPENTKPREYRWYINGDTYGFKTETDLIHFTLVWL